MIGVRYASLWEDLNLVPADGPTFDNVTFTAITSSIFARSDDRQYSRHHDIHGNVPCGSPAWIGGFGEASDVPSFFLEPRADGYVFGVHVNREWWTTHKARLSKNLQETPLTDDRTIILGTLPGGYFPDHVRQCDEPVNLFGRFDRKQRRWEQRLERDGWVFDRDRPHFLTHRYLGIGYYNL